MVESPKIYSPEYYQRLYELEDRHWWNKGMKQVAKVLMVPALEHGNRSRILDAGCGTGNFMDWLGQFSSAQKIGIDISAHALRFCHDSGLKNISQASVADLPFHDETFDLVTCNDVLQHVVSKDLKILGEFFRVLRSEGFVYLRTNAPQKFVSNDDSSEDYHRYGRDEIIEKASGVGFQTLRATFANSVPSIAANFRNWLNARKSSSNPHKEHGYSGLAMHIPPEPLNSILFWFMKLEAKYLTNKNSVLPFGHSLVFLLKKPAVK